MTAFQLHRLVESGRRFNQRACRSHWPGRVDWTVLRGRGGGVDDGNWFHDVTRDRIWIFFGVGYELSGTVFGLRGGPSPLQKGIDRDIQNELTVEERSNWC